MTVHPFGPVFDKSCRVLILGSFPSVKSREAMFYYGHPQNRFWPVMAAVLGEELPRTVEEKRAMLLRNGIGLWDVIASCEITGSSDASIKNAVPNDIAGLTEGSDVRLVLLNGGLAGRLYERYQAVPGLKYIVLPSTSPANAAWRPERLKEAWKTAMNG